MAAECLTTITEQWIREKLNLEHQCLADVRSLSLPGTYKEKIKHLGISLKNFVRLKTLDLSCNALISVDGVQHLKMLERLNLYYNRIPSIEEVRVLCKLTTLKDLDLRLNPLTKRDPHYRLYLIHALSNLRKLDDCPVRDSDRKLAIMHFSAESGDVPLQTKPSLTDVTEFSNQRSSELRLASVNRMTKNFSFLDDKDDVVLNLVARSNWSQSEPQPFSGSFQKELESQLYHLQEGDLENLESASSQSQEAAKSILRSSLTKDSARHIQSKDPRMKGTSNGKSFSSLKVTKGPRVTFDPHVEKHRPGSRREKHLKPPKQMRVPAKGYFTPHPDHGDKPASSLMKIRPPSPISPGVKPSDSSNPILHPPRLSYHSLQETAGGTTQPEQHAQQQRGSYRKPLEMLLGLVDKHWTGQKSLHQDNNFLSQAVHILSMMEQDVSSREVEVRTLKEEVEELKQNAESRDQDHRAEIQRLTTQHEEAQGNTNNLNEHLKLVLEENVSLQKQLIKLEQQYLNSMMKSSRNTDLKEKLAEVEELKREVAVLREKVEDGEKVRELAGMLQESHRSLVATNERLLGELESPGRRP
ncbi:centrosomal protein of 72 kDa isoform X2 [Osmerus mordax]|uniref:centrosomal protein of 72 kDa isoform X2 n=1 Tax=Osmerus mordax TaxID=8014 RepID=UPI00350ED11F